MARNVRGKSETASVAKQSLVLAVLFLMTASLAVTALSSSQLVPTSGEATASGSASSNGIRNGDFETGDFSGWTTSGSPIINSNMSMVYHGSYSAIIYHNSDILWQGLNYPISKYTVFGYAMLAIGPVDDVNWHEIRLTITGPALPTVYLHYWLGGALPPDNSTDKYFPALIGLGSSQWSAINHVLINDLADKGISQYLGGTVTNITCQEGGATGTAYDSLYLTEYDPSSNPTPNAIVNGGFEFQNLTGWTLVGMSPYFTIIDYYRNEVYQGFFSANNNHYYEYFYQPLNFTVSSNTNFTGAIYALNAVDDYDWHEIMLTFVNESGAVVYLHYRVQTSQPLDTATNKYFLIGNTTYNWYWIDRNIFDDLAAKGLNPSSGWKVTCVTCQQDGMSCTVYDSLRLWNTGTQSLSPAVIIVLVAAVGAVILVAAVAAYVDRRHK